MVNCKPYSDCNSDIKLHSILNKYGLTIYSRTGRMAREDGEYSSWRENEQAIKILNKSIDYSIKM